MSKTTTKELSVATAMFHKQDVAFSKLIYSLTLKFVLVICTILMGVSFVEVFNPKKPPNPIKELCNQSNSNDSIMPPCLKKTF